MKPKGASASNGFTTYMVDRWAGKQAEINKIGMSRIC